MHARLSTAIFEHRLRPGLKLVEEELAGVFGSSRARVRDVLLKLSLEGLVHLQPNRGAFVAQPSIEETRQIVEARRVIEAATVRSAASRATKQDIGRLRALVDRETRAWSRQERLDAVRASREFHMAIAEVAGNAILSETLGNILLRGSLSVAVYAQRGSPGCLCADHAQLLEAITAKDARRAAHLMTRHLDEIERGLNLEEPRSNIDLRKALADDL